MKLLVFISMTLGLLLLVQQPARVLAYMSEEDEDEPPLMTDNISNNPSSGEPMMSSDPCYDRLTGKPQRCIPNFENVAYGRRVQASSTCGSPPISYCVNNNPNGNNGYSKKSVSSGGGGGYCEKCDAKVNGSVRESKFLTDLEETNTTCWVSGPVYEPGQLVNVTLDISFGKKYELTYIR